MKVVFENLGEIDVRAITTMGVSVKQDSSAVGYFGTGLKYALANVLRNRGKAVIYSGEDVYEFSSESSSIRGKKFDIVRMNNQDIGFTTELGKDYVIH